MMLRDPHQDRDAPRRVARTRRTLDDFIAVEHPSSFLDGAYAARDYDPEQGRLPTYMVELAWRIAVTACCTTALPGSPRCRCSSIFAIRMEIASCRTCGRGFREAQEAARGPLSIIKNNLRDAYVLAAQNELARAPSMSPTPAAWANDLLRARRIWRTSPVSACRSSSCVEDTGTPPDVAATSKR
jgi:hypothetical protein